MYIKKSVLVICSVILIIVTAVVTIGAVNPFGFANYDEFFRFSVISKTIKSMYYKDVPAADYANSAVQGFAGGTGDRYTNFMYGKEAQEYMEDVSGSFEGIGVYIENNIDDNTITVVSAISGTPAEEAGLVSGDKILMVNGVPYTGEQMNEAVNNIKGQEGTYAEIQVLKADSGEIVNLSVERRHIDIKTVKSKMIDGTRVGYISISQFIESTASDFESNLEGLIKDGANMLVIDLRNNPGGYMEAAVDVASNFVKSGDTVVYTLNKDGDRTDYNSKGKQRYIPMAVLVNRGSASASEILTGALKDYGLAYVIGEKSYGKGIVQTVFEIDESVVSVTTASYYTPSGVCIHDIGISPDLEVPMELSKYARLDSLDLNEDEQLSAAVKYLQENSKE